MLASLRVFLSAALPAVAYGQGGYVSSITGDPPPAIPLSPVAPSATEVRTSLILITQTPSSSFANETSFVTVVPSFAISTSASISSDPVRSSTFSAVSATGSPIGKQHGTGLSAEAKIGIGVTIPIVALGLAGFASLLWRRERGRNRAIKAAYLDESTHSGFMVASREDNHDPTKHELDATTAASTPMHSTQYELDSTATALSPSLPIDAPRQPSNPNKLMGQQTQLNAHEIASSDKMHTCGSSELDSTQKVSAEIDHDIPVDIGPAPVLPTSHMEQGSSLE